MISERARQEMQFYHDTDNYSDPQRYEEFALECRHNEKGVEIGVVIKYLAEQMLDRWPLAILETATATGLTAAGVKLVLGSFGIKSFYTSLDLEQNLLDYARARGRGDRFVRGDFNSLPFASNSFDIYIMMGAEGYRNSGFYPEVCRVLRFGGYYVMPQTGPNPVVSVEEQVNAARSSLIVLMADNYLIARK